MNTNPAVLQTHALLMGFGAGDDQGHGTFIPLADLSGDADALANWIVVSTATVAIAPDSAIDLPFTITVPASASPGGHYAAILIGTAGPGAAIGTSEVGVSSYISALVFVRVSGDVQESAEIEGFTSDQDTYQTPDVHFSFKVDNTGNVHVRPVGTIQIYNMFGKERGEISINATDTLGYVLPSSSREFDSEWQEQPSLFDIGPYTAVLTLAYGDNGTKSVSETIGFWIVPVDGILEMIFGGLLIGFLFVSALKRIVRRMFDKEMSRYGDTASSSVRERMDSAPRARTAAPETHPVSGGRANEVIDLRKKR